MTKREMLKALRTRAEAGESKRLLLAEYSKDWDPKPVATVLAGVTSAKLRAKYGLLNKVLLTLMVLLTLLKILSAVPLLLQLSSAIALPLLLVVPAINVVFTVEIARYRGYAYPTFGILALVALTRSFTPESLNASGIDQVFFFASIGLILAASMLSFYAGSKLFPDLRFAKARKDASGNYQITE